MNLYEVIAARVRALCRERSITPSELANLSAVPQTTMKSILNGESENLELVTIKKLCDGLKITLSAFFSQSEFDALKQKDELE